MNPDLIFKNKRLRAEQLIPYGFERMADAFVYQTHLLNQQFLMEVRITEVGAVSCKVIDLECGELYILHLVKEAGGSFVGSIREAYENVLLDIAEKCFAPEVFKSDGAKQVISYISENYGDALEFLWQRSPCSAIWRRKDNQKWYGVLMTVSKRKIGIDSDEEVELIDLRIDPEEINAVIDEIRYFPGYHMNKKHWVTICLDGPVPFEEIKKRIDTSRQLALKK